MKKMILITCTPFFLLDACSSENKIAGGAETKEVDTNQVTIYIPQDRDIKSSVLVSTDEHGDFNFMIKAPLLTADKPSKHRKPKFRGETSPDNSIEIKY